MFQSEYLLGPACRRPTTLTSLVLYYLHHRAVGRHPTTFESRSIPIGSMHSFHPRVFNKCVGPWEFMASITGIPSIPLRSARRLWNASSFSPQLAKSLQAVASTYAILTDSTKRPSADLPRTETATVRLNIENSAQPCTGIA
jgi:hypothetical protein